jgi:hypothetical protein
MNKFTEKQMDQIDELTAKIAILSANLHCTYGHASESFSCLGDDLRESFLWGCSRLVDEIKGHLENLTATPDKTDPEKPAVLSEAIGRATAQL